MIIPDKKKLATMIVADFHGAPEGPAEEGSDPYEALASEVIKAVKAGDARAVADSLRAFVAECGAESQEID